MGFGQQSNTKRTQFPLHVSNAFLELAIFKIGLSQLGIAIR